MLPKGEYKNWLPYIGLPPIMIYFGLIHRPGDWFTLITGESLLFFGYLAGVSDVRSKLVPNRLVMWMLGVWITCISVLTMFRPEQSVHFWLSALSGFALGGGLFLVVYILSKNGLGGGDVKFIAVAGLYMGLPAVLSTIFIGSVLASIVGISLLLLKKISRKDTLPLLPFLYIGIILSVMYP